MKRAVFAFLLCTAAGVPAWAQASPDLGGQWVLNRGLSEFPKEIGFTADWLNDAIAAAEAQSAGAPGAATPTGGGRGGRRGGGGATTGRGAAPNRAAPRESLDDAERVALLTTDVRNPPARLTITDLPAAVTITGASRPRTFHPNGKIEALDLSSTVTSEVTTTRVEQRLIVLYRVEQGRQLRYTYWRMQSPEQLIVDVEFVEPKGNGDKVKLVYERPGALDTSTASTAPATAPAQSRGVPAAGGTGIPVDQQPDAVLKGLMRLGVVVEDLSAQAAACGLKQDALTAMVEKHVTDGGLRVTKYADEDPYIYVNVVTTTAPNGLCVSRYDVDVYTNAAARLSYGSNAVLAQVLLLHKGGLAGGSASSHGPSVTTGVQEYVDEFAARIRNANK